MQHEYISSDIALRIKLAAKSKGLTVATVLEEVNLGRNTMANLKTSMPKADNLAKIADYLDCSVDYLLGRTSVSDFSLTGQEKSSPSELTESEQKIIDIFKRLTQTQQGEIIGRAQIIAEQNKKDYQKEDTIKLYSAARSSDGKPDGIVELTQEQYNRLINTPETDDDL